MYQTKLTKQQLAYNIGYHLRDNQQKSIEEVVVEVLTAHEEISKNNNKTLDKE